MNDKTWYDEVKEDFIKNINDSYTLNLAVSVLEDRKELLSDNLKLKEQLQQKEDIINKAKECVEELCDETDDTTCYDITKNRKKILLEILDNTVGRRIILR